MPVGRFHYRVVAQQTFCLLNGKVSGHRKLKKSVSFILGTFCQGHYNIYQLEKYLGFPSYLHVRKYSFEMKKYMEWLNIIKLKEEEIKFIQITLMSQPETFLHCLPTFHYKNPGKKMWEGSVRLWKSRGLSRPSPM